jgi:4'-phosphopantetheinyl transferase
LVDWPINRVSAPEGGWMDCEVWHIELDAMEPSTTSVAGLCDFERARAARFRFERDAARYVAAHWGLRRVLSKATGVDPAQIRLYADAAGKPHLASGQGIGFSLSHSAGTAIVAVSSEDDVGVDVERWRDLDDVDALAGAHLAPAEHQHWQALPVPRRQRAFITAWTRKEAALKALGTGLDVEPSCVPAGLDFDPVIWEPDPSRGGGRVEIRSAANADFVVSLARHRGGDRPTAGHAAR